MKICSFAAIYNVYYLIDVTVMFSQSLYSVTENAGLVEPVLVLSNPPSSDITVQVSNVDITATSE